jgi:hypothetical protein
MAAFNAMEWMNHKDNELVGVSVNVGGIKVALEGDISSIDDASVRKLVASQKEEIPAKFQGRTETGKKVTKSVKMPVKVAVAACDAHTKAGGELSNGQ